MQAQRAVPYHHRHNMYDKVPAAQAGEPVRPLFGVGSGLLGLLSHVPGVGKFFSRASKLQLVWRLLMDPRIPYSLKAVPLAVTLFALSPLNILGLFPGVGQIGVILMGATLFVHLSPSEVVDQHRAAMGDTMLGSDALEGFKRLDLAESLLWYSPAPRTSCYDAHANVTIGRFGSFPRA
jgi:hypothetical protein